MEFNTVKCESCGAKIKAALDAKHLKCEYCGTEILIKKDKPPEQNSGTEFLNAFQNNFSTNFRTAMTHTWRRILITVAIFIIVSIATILPIYFYVSSLLSDFTNNIGWSGISASNKEDNSPPVEESQDSSIVHKKDGTLFAGFDIPDGGYALYSAGLIPSRFGDPTL